MTHKGLGAVYLTYTQLKYAGACEDRYGFKNTFGLQVLATVTTAVAHAEAFDWDWAASALLTPDRCEAYRQRHKAYRFISNKHDGPTINAYYRFKAQAFAELYLQQGGPA